MHITCLTIGSRGDVQPFLALGHALTQRGHRVRLATHERFAPLAAELGLEFHSVGTDPLQMLRSEAGRRWLGSGQNPLALVQNMVALGRPLTKQLSRETEAALTETDAVVFSLFGNLAYHVAEARGLPSVMVHLQPVMGRTTAFPVPGSPGWPSNIPLVGRLYNWLTFFFAEQIFWQPYRPVVQEWRQSLGLKKMPFWGPYRQLKQERYPHLFAYSEHVVPRPADWPSHYHVTGYWPVTPPDWTLPQALQDFLNAGPPPIYIGFGSMIDADPRPLERMIKQAAAAVGQRAIVLQGWAGLENDRRQSGAEGDIYWLDEAPHEWLFPQMSAIVHHGGAGTTAAGLRAGRPTVVVPYFADQYFWGDRVAALGVGPQPIPRQKLTADRLTLALLQALNDDRMQQQAADLGSQLQNEDGLANAVHLIDEAFALKSTGR